MLTGGCSQSLSARSPSGAAASPGLAAARRLLSESVVASATVPRGALNAAVVVGATKAAPSDIAPALFADQADLRALVGSALLGGFAPNLEQTVSSRYGTVVARVVGARETPEGAEIYANVASIAWGGAPGYVQAASAYGPFPVRIRLGGPLGSLTVDGIDGAGDGEDIVPRSRKLFPAWALGQLIRSEDASVTSVGESIADAWMRANPGVVKPAQP
jgi:hypothetical protein